MRADIIKYIVENNQLQNWHEIEDGSLGWDTGYYFSCNYFDPRELINDLKGHFFIPEDDMERATKLWIEVIQILAGYGFKNDSDLEDTLRRIWDSHASQGIPPSV
jgi:hypothetical protein